MQKLLVINVVGLSQSLLGEHTPNMSAFAKAGEIKSISPVMPAVTCSVQTTYLTGLSPSEHGIVGNGWYFKDTSEVRFWLQSNHLVKGEMIWEAMRKHAPSATCANMFWWYNMYNSADYSVTPRPLYPADGRKLPDVYSHPMELREQLTEKLGTFPLFNFWGPMSNIVASTWITNATLEVMQDKDPTLTLCYLPHLDYVLQKEGPNSPLIADELKLIDDEVGRLIDFAKQSNREVVILSEYGIEPVDQPIHINRVLREAGYLTIKPETGTDMFDPGASKAFAVTDHQVAHIYFSHNFHHRLEINKTREDICQLLKKQIHIEHILSTPEEKAEFGIDHERAGDIVVIAKAGAWFTYYFWLDDEKAPDYARCVDIHRKPGYDPVELFFDPTLPAPKMSAMWRLIKKKLGFRTLMDLIPLQAELVKGSHGKYPSSPEYGAVFMTSSTVTSGKEFPAMDIKRILLDIIQD